MLRLGLWNRLDDIENADEIIHNIRESFDEIWRLDPVIWPVVKDTYMAALNSVFLLIYSLSIVSALFSFIMR